MLNEKSSDLVTRYEAMLAKGESHYFDAEEIEEIALQYELSGRYSDALHVIERGMQMHPSSIELGAHRAKYLLALRRVDEALMALKGLPEENEETTLIRAEIAFVSGESEAAIALLMERLKATDLSVEFCLDAVGIMHDYEEMDALVLFVHRAQKRLKKSADLLRELALIYEEEQQFSEAVTIYNQLLDNDPYAFADWYNLAKVYAATKAYEEAVEACDFALAIQENDGTVLSFKGYCLYDSGQYREALAIFKEFGALLDDKSVAHELMAECHIKLGEIPQANHHLAQAYELNPNSSNLCYQLATSYYDLGNTPKAEEFLHKTLELDSADAEAYAFLGEIKFHLGKLTEAKEFLLQSIQFDPDNSDTNLLMGDILTAEDAFAESIPYYEKALESHPFDVKLLFKRILAYFNMGDLETTTSLLAELDETALQVECRPEIPEEEREEFLIAKGVMEELKAILRKSLDEDI